MHPICWGTVGTHPIWYATSVRSCYNLKQARVIDTTLQMDERPPNAFIWAMIWTLNAWFAIHWLPKTEKMGFTMNRILVKQPLLSGRATALHAKGSKFNWCHREWWARPVPHQKLSGHLLPASVDHRLQFHMFIPCTSITYIQEAHIERVTPKCLPKCSALWAALSPPSLWTSLPKHGFQILKYWPAWLLLTTVSGIIFHLGYLCNYIPKMAFVFCTQAWHRWSVFS